jgi:hypothetical protein
LVMAAALVFQRVAHATFGIHPGSRGIRPG